MQVLEGYQRICNQAWSSRECQVAVGLNGEHLAKGAELVGEGHVATGMVIREHHDMVRSIALVPVRVLLLHMLQRFPNQL